MKCKLYCVLQEWYNRLRENLAKNKKLPFFLSHGFMHLIVLVVLVAITACIGVYVFRSSIPNEVIMDSSFQFLDKNNKPIKSPVTYLNVSIRPETDSNIFDITIKPLHGTDTTGRSKFPNDVFDSKVIWTWNNYYPNRIVFYNSKFNFPSAYEDSMNVSYHDKGFTFEWKNYPLYRSSNFDTKGNLLGEDDKNPYYSVYFKIDCGNYDLRESSEINVDLSDPENRNTVITFDNIVPVPTEIGINRITYKGKEAVESVLRNGGFYFNAKNTAKAHAADRLNLIFNVLIGTLIAFILDIVINLIYKWRRLKSSKE